MTTSTNTVGALEPMIPATRVPQAFDIAETFGIPAPLGLTLTGWSQPGPLTPPARLDYCFRPGVLSDLLGWLRERQTGCPDGLWIRGPTGCGKSSVVVETFARLHLDLIRVNGRQHLELADLLGHLTALDGDVLFQDGPLTLAARLGAVLLLDEVDLLDPGELAGLNGVLDGGPLMLAENGGEVVWPAPGFGLICTANTGGGGDPTGSYLGTQRMNLALLDRFSLMAVDYPEPAQEAELLARACPELPEPLRAAMIVVAGEVRALFVGGQEDRAPIEVTLSTRTLLRWARKVVLYRNAPQPLQHALDRALTGRAEPETRAAIFGIVQRVFGEEAGHG